MNAVVTLPLDNLADARQAVTRLEVAVELALAVLAEADEHGADAALRGTAQVFGAFNTLAQRRA